MTTGDVPLPEPADAAVMLRGAIAQMNFARQYTLSLLEATATDRWFEIPPGLPCNIAWQVGHLAVSQYGLMMYRVRGRCPDDLKLIPGSFRKKYSRQTTPSADESSQPAAADLMQRLAEVHRLAMSELAAVDPAVLSDPIDQPYAGYPNKLGAILFCPLHEQIHAGQIGLIRRALGLPPVR
jgi:hypothetical protein